MGGVLTLVVLGSFIGIMVRKEKKNRVQAGDRPANAAGGKA
jgi:hypothetical protein